MLALIPNAVRTLNLEIGSLLVPDLYMLALFIPAISFDVERRDHR